MLTAGCEARAPGKGVGALRCPELPAWPALQVVPAIHAHFGNAYSTWKTAANLLHSPHDAVAARYFESVKIKPTLVALANAPLTPRHWHELWHCMGTPYMHGFTLGDLFEHSAFEQMEAIRAITGVAVSECAFEAPLAVRAWGSGFEMLVRLRGASVAVGACIRGVAHHAAQSGRDGRAVSAGQS